MLLLPLCSYPTFRLEDADRHLGQYYHMYMYPFKGKDCGPGGTTGSSSSSSKNRDAASSASTSSVRPPQPQCGSPDKVNRYWPTAGNHDWESRCGSGSLRNYFAYMPIQQGKRCAQTPLLLDCSLMVTPICHNWLLGVQILEIFTLSTSIHTVSQPCRLATHPSCNCILASHMHAAAAWTSPPWMEA